MHDARRYKRRGDDGSSPAPISPMVWLSLGLGALFALATCPFAHAQSEECGRNGTWGGWQAWSDCSDGVQTRYRDCDPLPDGCLASSPFVCNGSYIDEQSCTGSGAGSTTPIPASSSSSSSSTSTSVPASTTTSILATILSTLSSSTSTSTFTSTSTPTSTSTSSSSTTSITATLPNNNQFPVDSCDWSEWGAWSTCTDTCGMCGSQQRFRTCPTSSNCTCTGDAFEKINCGSPVCIYPRTTCCSGYSAASVNNVFTCANTTSSGR